MTDGGNFPTGAKEHNKKIKNQIFLDLFLKLSWFKRLLSYSCAGGLWLRLELRLRSSVEINGTNI